MRNFLMIQNLLSNEDLGYLLNEMSNYEFKKSESNEMLLVYDVGCETSIFNTLSKCLSLVYRELENSYRCKIERDVGLAILKYEEGGFINMHRDWEPNDPYVVKFNKPRVDLGCIIYINDNYFGGEILFFNDEDEEIPFMSIKPNFGTCIIFDSSIYHKSSPIISGVKYSATTFIQIEDVVGNA